MIIIVSAIEKRKHVMKSSVSGIGITEYQFENKHVYEYHTIGTSDRGELCFEPIMYIPIVFFHLLFTLNRVHVCDCDLSFITSSITERLLLNVAQF